MRPVSRNPDTTRGRFVLSGESPNTQGHAVRNNRSRTIAPCDSFLIHLNPAILLNRIIENRAEHPVWAQLIARHVCRKILSEVLAYQDYYPSDHGHIANNQTVACLKVLPVAFPTLGFILLKKRSGKQYNRYPRACLAGRQGCSNVKQWLTTALHPTRTT